MRVCPFSTRKRSNRYNELAYRSSQPSVYHTKMGESRQVPFPTAQQVNLPACSPHCPFNAKRQAGKLQTNFIVISLTRFGTKSKSTAPKADFLTTWPSELQKKNDSSTTQIIPTTLPCGLSSSYLCWPVNFVQAGIVTIPTFSA